MVAFLPVGEYYKSEEVISEDTPTGGKYCYMLSIYYYKPDDVKRATDD